MQILTFTSLYPSAVRPRHGIFVETRLAAMQRIGGVKACVVAPVPWFPFAHPRFGRYAQYAMTERAETRLGNRVLYPRYLTVPGAGMYVQPLSMASAGAVAIRELHAAGVDFDVIDAHYFYPDGVAAALLARRFDKPLTITARGSDINLLSQHAWPRRLIAWAAREANAIVTVSEALALRLRELGVDPAKITVARNGVDSERFAPVERREARQRLGLPEGPLLVSIGNLVPEKGHDLVIAALTHLPGTGLVIVGDGPERSRLVERIASTGLAPRVTLLPALPQDELRWIYGAADVVVLASLREGLPNVVLEALACGRRVVATRVGGIPEVITEPVAGRVVGERAPAAIAREVAALLAAPEQVSRTRAFASRFDWAAAARAQIGALERAIATHGRRPVASGALP